MILFGRAWILPVVFLAPKSNTVPGTVTRRDKDMSANLTNLSDLKIPELKDELRKRSLPLGGNKDALIQRLKEAQASGTPSEAGEAAEGTTGGGGGEAGGAGDGSHLSEMPTLTSRAAADSSSAKNAAEDDNAKEEREEKAPPPSSSKNDADEMDADDSSLMPPCLHLLIQILASHSISLRTLLSHCSHVSVASRLVLHVQHGFITVLLILLAHEMVVHQNIGTRMSSSPFVIKSLSSVRLLCSSSSCKAFGGFLVFGVLVYSSDSSN